MLFVFQFRYYTYWQSVTTYCALLVVHNLQLVSPLLMNCHTQSNWDKWPEMSENTEGIRLAKSDCFSARYISISYSDVFTLQNQLSYAPFTYGTLINGSILFEYVQQSIFSRPYAPSIKDRCYFDRPCRVLRSLLIPAALRISQGRWGRFMTKNYRLWEILLNYIY